MPDAPRSPAPEHPPEPEPTRGPEPTRDPEPTPEPGRTPPRLTIGYVPGVMPDKWFGRWRERGLQPHLTGRQIGADAWADALASGEVTACFVRLGWHPADPTVERLREACHAIPLYEELRVAVLSVEDVLTVLGTLTTAELAAETTPQDRPPLDDAATAVRSTAAGLGPVVLPMSVARLHARKDVTFRELSDAPPVPVLLVWRKDLEAGEEAAVQRFVGVVRGRRPGSGRDGAPAASPGSPAGDDDGRARGGGGTTAGAKSRARNRSAGNGRGRTTNGAGRAGSRETGRKSAAPTERGRGRRPR